MKRASRFLLLILVIWGQMVWQPRLVEAAVSAGTVRGGAAHSTAPGRPVLAQITTVNETGTAAAGSDVKVLQQVAVGDEYLVHIDPAMHRKFGLFYPATYKFRLPAGAQNLIAQYRYSDGAWVNLPEKKSGDFFNGIDAARFDYLNGFAYLSARFSLSDDNLHLRVLDSAGAPVSLVFDSIPKFYDDRKGAVSILVDDWNFAFDAGTRTATDYLVARNLYFTVGLIAADVPWNSVQEKINQHGAFIEVGSHSLHHPCSAAAYQVSGYQAETAGSRDAITQNLTFPNHPYVTAFVEPCGYSDSSLYSAISGANYLVERSSNDFFGTASRFIDWDSFQGRYGRAGVTYNDGPAGDTPALLAEANAAFDNAMAIGGIYSLEDHAYNGYWHDGSYLLQHLDYIKGRSDVWYVPFGQMYQYHFLQEMRGNLTIQHLVPTTLVADFSAAPLVGNVPLPVSFTDASIGTVTQWMWDFGDGSTGSGPTPQHTYVTAGSFPVTLTVLGPLGSNSKTQPNYIKANVASTATVSITAPVNGASFTAPATIQFTATASGATISRIDYFAGSQFLGTTSAPPYSFTWSNVPPGQYSLTAQETDLSGATATSAAVSITVNATVPTAPAISNVKVVNGQAEVTFSQPASDGGSPIASYTVTASPGNIRATGSGSPISVTGLSNGTPYTFSVSATNAVGAGAASAPYIVLWPPPYGAVSSMAPAAVTFGPGGGAGQVTVNATGAWVANTENDWIVITSVSSFPGSGTLSYSVASNDTGKARTGTINVGNLFFTVRQPASDFSDNMDLSAWFYRYINSVYAAGISTGCGSNSFCTADPVTREQMAAFIVRGLNGEKFSYTAQPYFSDVPATSWSFPYVQKLKDLGLTTKAGSYGAASPVTREEAATFIIRALYGESFPYPATPYFSDVPPSAWSFKYVQKMKEQGLTTNSGAYDPSGIVTRDQMATFISRAFLGIMPSSTDVPSYHTAFRAGMIIGKNFEFTVPKQGSMIYSFDERGTFFASSDRGKTRNYSGNWVIDNSEGTLTLYNVQGMKPGYLETYTMVGGGGVFPPLVDYTNSSGATGANIMMIVK